MAERSTSCATHVRALDVVRPRPRARPVVLVLDPPCSSSSSCQCTYLESRPRTHPDVARLANPASPGPTRGSWRTVPSGIPPQTSAADSSPRVQSVRSTIDRKTLSSVRCTSSPSRIAIARAIASIVERPCACASARSRYGSLASPDTDTQGHVGEPRHAPPHLRGLPPGAVRHDQHDGPSRRGCARHRRSASRPRTGRASSGCTASLHASGSLGFPLCPRTMISLLARHAVARRPVLVDFEVSARCMTRTTRVRVARGGSGMSGQTQRRPSIRQTRHRNAVFSRRLTRPLRRASGDRAPRARARDRRGRAPTATIRSPVVG